MPPDTPIDPVLSVENLSIRFRGMPTDTIDHVGFDITGQDAVTWRKPLQRAKTCTA